MQSLDRRALVLGVPLCGGLGTLVGWLMERTAPVPRDDWLASVDEGIRLVVGGATGLAVAAVVIGALARGGSAVRIATACASATVGYVTVLAPLAVGLLGDGGGDSRVAATVTAVALLLPAALCGAVGGLVGAALRELVSATPGATGSPMRRGSV